MRRRVTLLEKLSVSQEHPPDAIGVQVFGDVDGEMLLLDEWNSDGEHIYHLTIGEQILAVEQVLEIKQDDSNR